MSAQIRKFTRRKAADPTSTRRKVRLEQGIYEDNYGRYAVVTMTGPDPEHPGKTKPHFKESKPRQPFSTPITTMRAIYQETRETLARHIELLTRSAPTPTTTATLREDVRIFVSGFKGTRKATADNEMRHWVRMLGSRARNTITSQEIRTALVTLEEDYISEATGKHLSPGMVKHCRATLKQFYDVMNSKSGYNPVRDVPAPTVIYDDARYVPRACVELIFAQIEDARWTSREGERGPLNLTKLRLQCIYYAGLSHAMLARIEARDLVELDAPKPKMYLRARRKGKTAKPRTVAVATSAVAALRALAANDGLGEFSRSSLAKTFALARDKAIVIWKQQYPGKPWPAPANLRSYDLRHSFATDVLLASNGNRGAVMTLLGHGSLEQGERYTQAAASLESSDAIDKMNVIYASRTPEPPQ